MVVGVVEEGGAACLKVWRRPEGGFVLEGGAGGCGGVRHGDDEERGVVERGSAGEFECAELRREPGS